MDEPLQWEHADESITLLGRAIDHFTDRHAAIRRYAKLLNDDPPANAVLYFHGDGGNGKSLLLRFLRTRCSTWLTPDNWQYLKRMRSEEKFLANLTEAHDAQPVPTAATDFELGTEDIVGRLRDLRTDLARYGFRFPHFDYACIDYWHANGVKSNEEIKALFPMEELDFAAAALGFVENVAPYGQLLAGVAALFNRHFGAQAAKGRVRRELDEDLFRDMQRWDRRKELIDHLPKYLAADLNAHLRNRRKIERVALFFDGHERFWSNVRNVVPAENPERDQWLRTLLNRLDLGAGIVAVVAGREIPPWQPGTEAVHFDVELHHVEEFTDADGEDYLRRIAEIDQALTRPLLDLARVGDGPDRVHPLYLGLAADVAVAARRRGMRLTPNDLAASLARSDKPHELIRRLWQYVDQESRDAIRALSATRAFDWPVYRRLDQNLGLGASQARFRVLTAFSFVRPVPGATKPTYRIHALMRQLLRDDPLPIVRSAHEVLEAYYREQTDPAAVAEAIYHANQQDWQRGVEEWLDRFKTALRASRYDECRALADVRHELVHGTPYWTGRIASQIGQLAAALAQHQAAETAFRESVAAQTVLVDGGTTDPLPHHALGEAETGLGDILTQQSRYGEAATAYQRAAGAYDRALALTPDDARAEVGKGSALRGLGVTLYRQSRLDEAIAAYRTSLAALDRAVGVSPDDAKAHHRRGTALFSMGDALARQTRNEEATTVYRQGLAALDRALALTPDDVTIVNQSGVARLSVANHLAQQDRPDEAIAVYHESVAAFDRALALAPASIICHNNKGLVLQSLGEVLFARGRHDEAAAAFKQGIAALDRALTLAPRYTYAHINRGLALASLGELLARQDRPDEAAGSCREAIAAYDRALALAPNIAQALHNKGEAFATLGRLLSTPTRPDAAAAAYRESVSAYDGALALAPDYTYALNGKGSALLGLGGILTGEDRLDEAVTAYHAAVSALDRALCLAPDYAFAASNRGTAMSALGDILARQAQPEEAAATYAEALTAYERALAISPAYVNALHGQGETLDRLGTLILDTGKPETVAEACRRFVAARESLSHAAQLAPDHAEVRASLDRVGARLAELGCNAQ